MTAALPTATPEPRFLDWLQYAGDDALKTWTQHRLAEPAEHIVYLRQLASGALYVGITRADCFKQRMRAHDRTAARDGLPGAPSEFYTLVPRPRRGRRPARVPRPVRGAAAGSGGDLRPRRRGLRSVRPLAGCPLPGPCVARRRALVGAQLVRAARERRRHTMVVLYARISARGLERRAPSRGRLEALRRPLGLLALDSFPLLCFCLCRDRCKSA
jgi:hypothetical protein